MTTAATTPETAELKVRLKATWMAGDYDRFSRYLEPSAREFFARLQVPRGSRLLDIACGSGQVTLMAARTGVDATGIDIATNLIERARARAAEAGLAVNFDDGDAEELPYPDASFDFVVSLIGAMFAPRPERVAAEMLRVCRPGGVIAMGNWTKEGFVGEMFQAISKFIAPSGMPSPVLWGDEETVRRRFGNGVSSLQMTRTDYLFEYPFPPGEAVEFFRLYYGPMGRAFASLGPDLQQALRQTLTNLFTSNNQAGAGSTRIYGQYLQVLATRA
jgi:ubiquinone/menaquinone biosynthesis C-methylase UbiE